MGEKLFTAEAMSAVYDHAEMNGCTASGPITYPICGRQDVLVCWAIVERKTPPLVATLFLVFKNKEGAIVVHELLGAFGLRFLGAYEETGMFFIKIGGPGIKPGSLKVSLTKLGLEPAAKAVVFN